MYYFFVICFQSQTATRTPTINQTIIESITSAPIPYPKEPIIPDEPIIPISPLTIKGKANSIIDNADIIIFIVIKLVNFLITTFS